MTVGIVGLGLIGGSMAKAYSRDGCHTVFGADMDSSIVEYAILRRELNGELTEKNIGQCG